MTRRDLVRSFMMAVVFSTVILLILGLTEYTSMEWIGGYFFGFALLSFGLMEFLFPYIPSDLPVIVAWLMYLPAMVVLYWPVALLGILVTRMVRRTLRGESVPEPSPEGA